MEIYPFLWFKHTMGMTHLRIWHHHDGQHYDHGIRDCDVMQCWYMGTDVAEETAPSVCNFTLLRSNRKRSKINLRYDKIWQCVFRSWSCGFWHRAVLYAGNSILKKRVSDRYKTQCYFEFKVKRSRYRPGVAQRAGRVIALLFHDRGTRRAWVVSSTPWPHFTPGKDPVPILQEAGWVQGLVWTGRKISSPPRFDPRPSSL